MSQEEKDDDDDVGVSSLPVCLSCSMSVSKILGGGQFNKTFTWVIIHKCTHCSQTLKQWLHL